MCPSSPPHFTNDIPSNVSQVRTRSTIIEISHCLENHKGYHWMQILQREHQRMIDKFRNMLKLRKYSQYLVYVIMMIANNNSQYPTNSLRM